MKIDNNNKKDGETTDASREKKQEEVEGNLENTA